MEINNRIYSEICSILHNLGSHGDGKQWMFDGGGKGIGGKDDCGDGPHCLIRGGQDCIFIYRGGWRFAIDTVVKTMFPMVLDGIRREAGSLVIPDDVLGSLEFHVGELLKTLNRGWRSHGNEDEAEMGLGSAAIDKIYGKCTREPDGETDIGFLTKEDADIVSREAEAWIGQMREAYESINRKRGSFYEESIFWKELHTKLERIRGFRMSRKYEFVVNVLRCSSKILVATTLESLFSSDKYLRLAEAFNRFYGSLNFTNIYFPSDMDQFRREVTGSTRIICESFRRQPMAVRKSVMMHAENLIDLIIRKVCSCDLSTCLECCEELLSECIKNTLLLTDTCDDESCEVISLESSAAYEFKGASRLSKFYLCFSTFREFALFVSSFRDLGVLFSGALGGAEHCQGRIEERGGCYGDLLEELESQLAAMKLKLCPQSEMSGDEPCSTLNPVLSLDKYEIFVSDLFNMLCEGIDEIEVSNLSEHFDTESDRHLAPSMGILVCNEEESLRFTKLFWIMKRFHSFIGSSVFSDRTFSSRLRILGYLDKMPDIDLGEEDIFQRVMRLSVIHDQSKEIDRVVDLFFKVRDNEIIQLSEFRRRRSRIKNLIHHEVTGWCGSVPKSDFMDCKVVGTVEIGQNGIRRIGPTIDRILLCKLGEYLSISASGVSDIASIVPQDIHKMMRSLKEIQPAYNELYKGCDIFNRVLEDIQEDIDLFKCEIDSVFDSMKEIWGVRWRYGKGIRMEGFTRSVGELENKVYSYRFLMKKVSKAEMRTIFSEQIKKEEIRFSLDSSSYLKFFEFHDRDVVLRSVSRSMRSVFSQYLDSIVHALETDNSGLFVSRHRIRVGDGGMVGSSGGRSVSIDPPLSEYFRILERIFPTTDRYFFDGVFERFCPSGEIKGKMEAVVELVISKYMFCSDILKSLTVPSLPDKLYERFTVARDFHRNRETIARNEIPFFIFEHAMDVSESSDVFRRVCDEVSDSVDKGNLKAYRMLDMGMCSTGSEPGFVGSSGSSPHDEGGSEEDCRSVGECDRLSGVSRVLLVDEYLKSEEFKILGSLNDVVLEYQLRMPEISIEAIEERKRAVVEQNTRIIESFLKDVPYDIIKDEQVEMTRRARQLSDELDELTREEDEFQFCSKLKPYKSRYIRFTGRVESLNRVLDLIGFPSVSNSVGDRTADVEREWARFSSLVVSLRKHESQSIESMNTREFTELINSIDTKVFHSEYYRTFLGRVEGYRKAAEYLEDLRGHYVTKKYFDRSMKLGEFLVSFEEADIRLRLSNSKMEYEVRKYVERIRWEMKMFRMEIKYGAGGCEGMVSNISDVENRFNELFVEHRSVVRFNTNGFFPSEMDGIGRSIDEYMSVIEKVGQVQRGIVELASVCDSGFLSFEASKYLLIKERYLRLIADGEAADATGSGGVRLSHILLFKSTFDEMNKGLDEVMRGLGVFLETYREHAPRLFFVSDKDMIKALNDRRHCVEILKLTFNIDDVVVRDRYVTGIVSGGETLTLRKGVSIEQDVGCFFMHFEIEMKDVLKHHFMRGIEGDEPDYIPDGCPSVISELISEFRYFNGKRHVKTFRLKSLEREVERYSKDILNLYPKPALRNGILQMECILDVEYDFEYYPPTDMVFTPLTSKIFSSICVSLLNLSGLILYGRSGTGKTESVRYYCRSIGKAVFVFCCNRDCDIYTLKNIIRGAVLTGSYVCFDEFNRLDEGVMSSATELILSNKDKTKFLLTMNIGYRGRQELPKSLRGIFGEIRVENPDMKDIVDYYCGNMSDKVYKVMKRLEDTVSKQKHYDFGLRAFKTMFKNTAHGENSIVRSLAYFYMASLSGKDKMILRRELKHAFGESVETGLTYFDMLNHGVSTKNGVIVFGAAHVGKSEIIRVVSNNRGSRCFYYNPMNTMHLFGHSDEFTGEWKDSEFVRDLRGGLHEDREMWFVFDGVIDSAWIENFNSILDDNRLLCLSSGERIKIPSHYRFVFECVSLEDITPATMTRVFLLHMDTSELFSSGSGCRPHCDGFGGEAEHDVPGREEIKKPLFTDLIPTTELDSCAGMIVDIVRRERVLIIRGLSGVGKKSLVEELFKDNLVIVNGREFSSTKFRSSVDGGIRVIRGSEVCDVEKIFYIESFNSGDVGVAELVREYSEYGRIGELTVRNTVIICGVDTDSDSRDVWDVNVQRLFMRVKSVVMDVPKDLPLLFGEGVRKVLRSTKYFHESGRITQIVLSLHGNLGLSLRETFRFIRTLDKLKVDDDPLPDVLYFEMRCHFGERDAMIREIQRVFGTQPNRIEFDLASKRFRRDWKHSDISIVGFLLHRGHNVIVEGARMSGKHRLLDECMKHIGSDVRVVDRGEEERIDGQTVFLVEDASRLSKEISSSCITFRLRRLAQYSLDLVKVYNRICDGDDGSYESILEECVVSERGIYIDFPDEEACFSSEPLVDSDKEVGQHPLSCEHPTVVTMESFGKFVGFGKMFIEIARSFRKRQEERRRFLCDGIQKIREFEHESESLRHESSRKKKSLHELSEQLNGRLEEIVYEQGVVEREKSIVNRRREDLDRVLKLNQGKRKVIDEKLQSVRILQDESLRGLSEISKNNLSEIKMLVKPPEIVKNTVEAVFYMVEGFQEGGELSGRRRGSRVEWRRLVQFMKGEDFISKVMDCRSAKLSGALESLMCDPDFTYEKAQNASKACGPLFKWVVANYRHAKVLLEIRPLEREIGELEMEMKDIERSIDDEERKLGVFEKRIGVMKEKYAVSVVELESTRTEILSIEGRLELIDKIRAKLSDESDEWRRMKYLCPIRYVLTSREWIFSHNRNVFVYGCELGKIPRISGFISTSVKDRNYKQVLYNCCHYKNDVVVKGCNEFNVDVYRALKHQMRNPEYSIVVMSDTGHNPYEEYTYGYKVKERFVAEEGETLGRQEERLLELIASSAGLEEIWLHREMLEKERRAARGCSVKREIYEVLNSIFHEENRRFVESYGMNLSFGVYKEYVEKELLPMIGKQFCSDGVSAAGHSGNSIWDSVVGIEMDSVKDMMSKSINAFYSKSLPSSTDGYDDYTDEILRFGFDYTFITPWDDVVCMVEDRMPIAFTISAGCTENNKRIHNMLSEVCEEHKMYVVKNIHLLENSRKAGNCRFIFTTEDRDMNPLMENTRVVYCRTTGDYETVRKGLADMAGSSDEMVDFHARMVSSGHEFCTRDLMICLRSREHCNSEYLKTIVYYNKMDGNSSLKQ